jgi:hypothetical protein
MSTFRPVDEQVRILMRGVDFGDAQTYTNMEKELRQRLQESYDTGRPLRVYCGFDPSSSDLHLGHTIPMRKLRQFQDLGHDVTFLIGTFTGMLGDPSDKESVRKQQSLDEALQKGATYADPHTLQSRMAAGTELWRCHRLGVQLHSAAIPHPRQLRQTVRTGRRHLAARILLRTDAGLRRRCSGNRRADRRQ